MNPTNESETSDSVTEEKPSILNEAAAAEDQPTEDPSDDTPSTAPANDESSSSNVPQQPIILPPSLESLPRAEHLATQRHRWNTNEEIAAVLINFERHPEWLFKEVKIRPKSGSMLLYSRKKVRYRRDGYCWKKRKDGKTTREDHMKLKVQGTECIYGCYVHSAILPTFHRRCYWLLQNPDIVLVHYLNVPYPDDAKLLVVASVSLWAERKEWSKEELISQLRPMFLSQDEPNLNNELEVSTAETVEAIVSQLMEKQRLARSGTVSVASATTCTSNSHNGRSGGQNNRADHSSKTTDAGLNEMPHSLRRLSTGGNGFIRLEPRPPPASSSHSTNSNNVSTCINTVSQARTTMTTDLTALYGNDGLQGVLQLATTDHQQSTFVLTRDSSPPTSTSSASSSSSSLSVASSFNNGDSSQIVQLELPITSQDQLVAKQENIDIDFSFYSVNCQSTTPAPPSNITSPMNFNDSSPALPFPPFYSLSSTSNANHVVNDMRPSDELLSDHGSYRMPMDCLFNETLDLSHDDIQRTLSANLIHETAFHGSVDGSSGGGIDEGMDSAIGSEHGSRTLDTGSHSIDDDLLVNLDAFDMLTEFSDLDCHDTTIDSLISIQQSDHMPTNGPTPISIEPATPTRCNGNDGIPDHLVLADITDFSPEWAPTEGGSKLLVTGSFSCGGPYSITFDGSAVPAVWVQHGVLRCFCPPHAAGRVQLQVLRQGVPFTHPSIFEYRQLPTAQSLLLPLSAVELGSRNWNHSLLNFLVNRLESLSAQLLVQGNGIEQLFKSLKTYLDSGEVEMHTAEEQIVSICRQLVAKRWKNQSMESEESSCSTHPLASSFPPTTTGSEKMNILHLAAALGLLRVICTLLNWRLENTSPRLENEINPLAVDQQMGYTPLMWACAHGHRDAVALLAQWTPSALDVADRLGQTAWTVARQRGHHALADELETRRILSVRRSNVSNIETPPIPVKSSSVGTKTFGDAVTTRQMLMAKRSSVDSMSNNNEITGTGSNNNPSPGAGYWRRPNVAKAHKLSRDDRSYSLPLGTAPGYSSGRNSTASNISSIVHDPSPSPLLDSTAACGNNIARGACVRRESINSLDLQQHLSPLTSIEQNTRVLTLAEQIIAAIPDRIKNETTEDMVVGWSPSDLDSCAVSEVQSVEGSIDLAVGGSDGPSLDAADFTFDFSDQQYRYCETATPSSSLSPASSSCLQSPCSFSVNSPSPPPTTADFSEFLQASASLFVRDFSNLTLSDNEQRELYEAAKTIQKAYRSYVGRKRAEEQEKERAAAVIIQNYYRRYKQYVYLKQMTKAAVVIQNQFRSYYEHKRFKKNMESPSTSSGVSSSMAGLAGYRSYREASIPSATASSGRPSREGTPTSSALKRTYSQRRQHQAARKIQQFMRQSKNKLQKERALLRMASEPAENSTQAEHSNQQQLL